VTAAGAAPPSCFVSPCSSGSLFCASRIGTQDVNRNWEEFLTQTKSGIQNDTPQINSSPRCSPAYCFPFCGHDVTSVADSPSSDSTSKQPRQAVVAPEEIDIANALSDAFPTVANHVLPLVVSIENRPGMSSHHILVERRHNRYDNSFARLKWLFL